MNHFKLIAILWLLALALPVFSQKNGAIKGQSMAGTAIIVLSQKDSIIQDFTRAAGNGNFSINGLDTGRYRLLVTYPGYADYSEAFELTLSKNTHDFGNLKLILKSKLLQEVVVKGNISAIKIKGDTTEYNARAYKLNANAKVEDLLKRLPGIQVDKDGKITAQGQTVNRVLVDGEEFFGDDPTLVTRNLRADMIDKVQLYDKKSDRAAFTGIDDGVRSKTINVTLQEDKKNGYFGKLDGGAGTDGYYKGQALFNLFKPRLKFSAYGIAGNDGKTSLDWQDNAKYASSNLDMSSMGSIIDLGGYDELESFSGKYGGRGSPLARTGGIHYDNKWNKDQQYLNANFKIGALTVDGTQESATENNLPDGVISSSSNGDFRNYIFRQKLDAGYRINLNTNEELKIGISVSLKNTQEENHNFSSSSAKGILLNNQNAGTDNQGEKQIYGINAQYTHKFKKSGRTIAFGIAEAANQSQAKGYLRSNINFYDQTGLMDSTQKTDQYKVNKGNEQGFNTSLAYTEPIVKHLSLLLNYGFGLSSSKSDKRSYNASGIANYNLLDSLYSNDFKLNQASNQFGTTLNYSAGKWVLNAGTNGNSINFQQLDGYTGNLFKRKFILFNPQANLLYQISQQTSLRINYNGNGSAPNINQLQPVRINNDPLNITIGNPDLNPSFSNNYLVRYESHPQTSNQNFAFFGHYSATNKAVVNDRFTDAAGRSTNRYINLNGYTTSDLGLSFYYDTKIKAIDISAGINLNTGSNFSYSFSNNALNRVKTQYYSAQARLSKFVQSKYDFYFSAGPAYTFSGSSLQQAVNNNGWGFTGNGNFNIHFPAKLLLATNMTYQYNGRTQTFQTDFSRLIINSSLSKTLTKAENLKLMLTVNDLLNQNNGFNRSINNSQISQSSYSTIRRYFLLSLTYDFNEILKSNPKK